MSTHKVDVIRIGEVEKHPNADRMCLVRVHGFTCCVGIDQFKPGDLAAYIEPDMVVDITRPEFEFMKEWPGGGVGGNKDLYRIRVKRLRGVISQGLVVEAPEGLSEGDCAMEALGVTRYEPPIDSSTFGEAEGAPSGRYAPSYDLENWRRHSHLLHDGEPVLITEKIHGANARFCWQSDAIDEEGNVGRIYCGSRTQWKKKYEKNLWWRAVKYNPWIEEFCFNHSEVILYGEVFGQVSDLKYGATTDHPIFFRAFDLLVGNEWVDWESIKSNYPDIIPHWAPILYEGAYDKSKIDKLANGKSLISAANHIREGIVIQPVVERTDLEIGRVKLKVVSDDYLSR